MRQTLALTALLLTTLQAHAADPAGRWITASGNLEVEIAPCAAAWCGTVTRVIANRSMSREGEAMQPADTRPALGLQLLSGFVPSEHGADGPLQWTGDIYNRENAKTYRCTLALDANGALVVRPYIGLPLFGKTQVWTRAPTPQP